MPPQAEILNTMIDIHAHILPGVDDGAESSQEAIEMCRMAAGQGVEVIVATPHIHDGVHEPPGPESLQELVRELNARLSGLIRIELGCELRFTHEVVKHICEDRSAPTLAGGPYALIEFPHAIIPPGSERTLLELIYRGIKPIIAHPERNRMLASEPWRFYPLAEMGILGQLDAGSITGQFGNKVQEASRTMLENGLIQIIGSDCHNLRNRPPSMQAAISALSQILGADHARMMAYDNPRAVIKGEALPYLPTPTDPSKKKKRWILFQ
jgi:protein-tyrosine phosphatase